MEELPNRAARPDHRGIRLHTPTVPEVDPDIPFPDADPDPPPPPQDNPEPLPPGSPPTQKLNKDG